MKKLLLILLCLPLIFSSCVNHLDEAELIYQQGMNQYQFNPNSTTERSREILNEAIIKANMISHHQKHYIKAQNLIISIDSVLLSWEQEEIRLKREIQEEEERRLKRKEERLNLLNKNIEDSLKRLDRKYPNLVGRWVLNETNYSSTLNSIVRIYKKGGAYYQSMVFDKDGSESVLKLNKRSNKRYDVIGKSDYNIINSDRELEFWDKQGYFLTCKKRKEAKEVKKKKTLESLLKDAIGSNVFNYRYDNELGSPKTINGTNNTYWVSYYSDLDITLISLKKTEIILNSSKGKYPYLSPTLKTID
jgi:hypothetical protein